MMTTAPAGATTLEVSDSVVSARGVPVRFYGPAARETGAVIVFAHGGGFNWGSLDDYDRICRNLAEATGSKVVSVDYRLAPEHKFPAGFDDVLDATEWAASHLAKHGGDGCKLIVAGDSAGACLAAGVSQKAVRERAVKLDGQLLLYPMIEYYDRTPSEFHSLSDRFHPSFEAIKGAWDKYFADPRDADKPYAVPTRGTNLSTLPPAFVVTASNDPLRFEAEAYAKLMADAGVNVKLKRYPDVAHGFLGEDQRSRGVHDALEDISAWIDGIGRETE